jgi:hypothetical protein
LCNGSVILLLVTANWLVTPSFRQLYKLKPKVTGFRLHDVLEAPGVDKLTAAEPVDGRRTGSLVNGHTHGNRTRVYTNGNRQGVARSDEVIQCSVCPAEANS